MRPPSPPRYSLHQHGVNACETPLGLVAVHAAADRTDETNRALESKREMVDHIQDMQRRVENEQSGEAMVELAVLVLHSQGRYRTLEWLVVANN